MTPEFITAEYLKSLYEPPVPRTTYARPEVESQGLDPQIPTMTDLTREEVKARLEASEARVSSIVESMRADAAELRAELREGNAQLKAQGEVAKANAAAFQAEADKFYADARSLLAESRTALGEIRLAGEQNRSAVMGMGYKVITWTLGTILAVGSVSIGVYNALKRSPVSAPTSQPATQIPRPRQVRVRRQHKNRLPSPDTSPRSGGVFMACGLRRGCSSESGDQHQCQPGSRALQPPRPAGHSCVVAHGSGPSTVP